MTYKKIIQMIDEYLEEPHSIHKDWVEVLLICKQALLDNDIQKAEIERLEDMLDGCVSSERNAVDNIPYERTEAIKEFADRLKEKVCSHNCRYFGNVYDIKAVEVKDIDNLVKEMTENITKIEHNSLCETETYKGEK